jgi:hypothetical protein
MGSREMRCRRPPPGESGNGESGCGVKRSMLGFCLKQKSKMRSETFRDAE